MACLAQLIVVVALAGAAQGHTYHKGPCPAVQPLTDFDMNRFLGRWFVIQKTTTASKCVTYTFTASAKRGEYDLEQESIHPLFRQYHYRGHITTPSSGPAAQMSVKFSMNLLGSASYMVVSTDYETYGAIFTCQEIFGNLGHRRSVTILSRYLTLNQATLDEIRSRISSFGVDVRDLNEIDQLCCNNNSTSDEDEDDSGESLTITGNPNINMAHDLEWRGSFGDNRPNTTNQDMWFP